MLNSNAMALRTQMMIGGLGCVIAWTAMVGQSSAHHPEGEYVQSMVRPGLEYLEQGFSREEYGGEALIALALYKGGRDPDNTRRIQEGIKKVQGFLAGNPRPVSLFRLYSVSVSTILLCEINPQKYQREIEQLLDLILARQQDNGGWGYTGRNTGDVSQTQYCVLALWTAQKAGFRINPNVGAKALNWLMTVQDASNGGWPYQGIYRGNLVRIQQGSVTPALAAGGLGSVYIAADWLGYGKDEEARNAKQSDGLPPAVTIVKDDDDEEEVELVSINESALKACKAQGNAYFRNFSPEAPAWVFYYLYSYERYASFREKAEDTNNEEPRWYNLGAEYLKSQQGNDGAWTAVETDETDDISTAFALLFLLRGTKKSLGRAAYTDGTLQGGQGLRDDAEVALKNNRVVSIPVAKDLPQLLGMLENPDADELEFFAESVESLDLSDPSMSKTQMRAMVYNLVNHEQYAARLIAVRTLGKERLMENVPALIYALTDPNFEIGREANKGLKFISRKLEGYDVSENPSPEELKGLKRRWEEWYLDVVPDGQLLD